MDGYLKEYHETRNNIRNTSARWHQGMRREPEVSTDTEERPS